jgi:hypothetical protein
MRYQVIVLRLPENEKQNALLDPIFENVFDANEDTADEIGEMAGVAIEEAIRCDVAAREDAK